MLQEIIDQYFPQENKPETKEKESPQIFKLPISYLDPEKVFDLNPIVSNDLELLSTENPESRAMYDYLFHPQHQFALDNIPLWNRQYTTNTDFLLESQQIIENLSMYKKTMETNKYRLSYDSLIEIWKSTREDPQFLDKYNYIEWNMFEHLNTNPLFLQSISLANISSPVISFLIPILFLILPFIILKIQGIPISMTIYIDVLRDIAKHHFIGKTLTSMQSLNIQNIAYVIFTFFMYIYQIYQNVVSFTRFYNNVQQINKHLYEMMHYLDYTLYSMRTFSTLIENKSTYKDFNNELMKHYTILSELQKEIGKIHPFSPSLFKLTEIGELLKSYYVLHSNNDYAESLYYSFGFEGYMNNLLGLYENFSLNNISKSSFDISNTSMEGLYYPPHMGMDYITNDCTFEKNQIITGPNASGKTTYLKSTMINIIFTQQTGFGFYSSCVLNPYTHIHSYLNIPDTSGRDSLFQAESRRCKEILDMIELTDSKNSHHLCTFDELYSGTNPEEAAKSAYSFLMYLSKNKNVDFILTTHYTAICTRMKKEKHIENWKMDALVSEDDDIQYTYKIKKGISKIQGAIKVLKDMNYPTEIIDSILEWK